MAGEALVPKLPPVSMPTTTNRQRRARPSSPLALRRGGDGAAWLDVGAWVGFAASSAG